MSRLVLIVVTTFMLFMGGFGAVLVGQPMARAIAYERKTTLEPPDGRAEQIVAALSSGSAVANMQHAATISVTLLLPVQHGENFTLTVPVDIDFDLDVAVAEDRTRILRLLQYEVPVVDVVDLAGSEVLLASQPNLIPTPTPDPALGPPHVDVVVNLRHGPDTGFQIAGQARPGDLFAVFARNADSSWYQVRMADGTTGWMAAYLIRGLIDEEELEIIPGVPALVPTPTPTPAKDKP
jgi:hypothetical protein